MKILSILLPIFLIALQVSATENDNIRTSVDKAEGFRGVAWGTNIATLKDMKFDYEFKDHGTIRKSYKRINDKLKIGGAEIMSISYGFWQDQLFKVQIMVDIFNWSALEQVIFAKYGDHKKHENSRCFEYSWISGKTKIEMHNCPNRIEFETHAFVTLSSVEIEKQRDAFIRQEEALNKQREEKLKHKMKKRAKEAAESDL